MQRLLSLLFLCTVFSPVLNAQENGNFLRPPKRAHHEVVYDEGSKTVLMSCGSTPLNGGTSFDVFNDIWSFDGKSWKQSGNAGDQRSSTRMAYDTKRKKLFSFGGYSNNKSMADLRVLENGEWKVLSDIPEMKAAEPGFVYDIDRDRLIVFGGSAGRGMASNETWEWDGSSWKKLDISGLGGRHSFAMVYDSIRKKTVLFGGMGTTPDIIFGDTWEFDGKAWTKVSESGPEKRIAPGYAYDVKRELMILFSGSTSNGMAGDTWAWNGKEWKKLSDEGPPGRAMGYMAYDKNRDRIVLFGGRLGWPNDIDDTWEWDGKQWSEFKK